MREEIRPLTSLRFVAALFVFLHHAPLTSGFADYFRLAWGGVSFFFLLSGFILTYCYSSRFALGLSWGAIRDFYVARTARIYPGYLTALIAMTATLAAIGALDRPRFVEAFATQALVVQSWIPDIHIYNGLNNVGWSISDEAFFYVLFPILIVAALRYIRTVAAAAIAIGTLWAVLAFGMLHVSSTWFNWSYVLPIMRLPEFIVGVLLAIVARRETRVPTFSPTARELLAIVLVAFAFGISPFIPDALRFAAWTIPAFALLLLVFSEQNGAISRALSAPLLVRLGEISYAFYLIHPMALRIAGVAHAPPALVTIVAFTLALGLSFALFRYIEVPLRRAIKAAASPLPRPVYETL